MLKKLLPPDCASVVSSMQPLKYERLWIKKSQLCHVMAGNQIPSQKLGGGHVLDFSLSSL